MVFQNLVCEGGGVKGIAYVGAVKRLEEEGILQGIQRFGGTSAGAINATLLACGFNSAEQREKLWEMDFNKFMDDSFGVIMDTKRFFTEYGWHKGDYFHSWISDLIAEKLGTSSATFRDFQKQGKPDLYVYGTNLSTGHGKVFSAEHTPTTRVADAVRISMSIPLFFKAFIGDDHQVYVDGGVLNNYPIRLFDREKYLNDPGSHLPNAAYDNENQKLAELRPDSSRYIHNTETLGLRLDTQKEIAAFRYGKVEVKNNIDGFISYAKALVSTILDAQSASHLESDDWKRTIYIDTLGVGTTDFDISDAKKEALIQSGYDMTERYLQLDDKSAERSV